jgi:hypothetical protein
MLKKSYYQLALEQNELAINGQRALGIPDPKALFELLSMRAVLKDLIIEELTNQLTEAESLKKVS